jgi:hypothetical protein
MPSGHHNCKKVARQIKTGHCFKKLLAAKLISSLAHARTEIGILAGVGCPQLTKNKKKE